MRHDIGQLGQLCLQKLFDFRQIADPRHHIETLPAPVMFTQQRLADGHGVKLADIGANRQSVYGRRADDRQIPNARQRQLQRPRDGRCCQREHVDIGPQLFEPLFMRDTKALLFIDHQKPKIVELNAFGQQRVRAHHDIDGAGCHPLLGLGRLFRPDKARQLPHMDRKAAKPFRKALGMLPGQQRCGRDHRHLNAGHRCNKGCAHGHFGFAKADIAANQAVHGTACCHIGHHIADGAQLIVGFFVRKARGERVPHARR